MCQSVFYTGCVVGSKSTLINFKEALTFKATKPVIPCFLLGGLTLSQHFPVATCMYSSVFLHLANTHCMATVFICTSTTVVPGPLDPSYTMT